MSYSEEELIEVHSDIKGKMSDYDILKNVPTIDGVAVHGDITESGKYTDETPTAGSKRLITSGAMRAAMERGDLKGPKGDDGYSPRIEVVNIGSGYRVNITDVDGTKYFDVICGENAPGTHTHDERYYTESETDSLIGEAEVRSQRLVSDLASQTDAKLSEKSDKTHTHDDTYYSKSEISDLISDAKTEVSDAAQELVNALETQTEEKLANKSNTNHTHNDLYYTEDETDNLISQSENRSLLLVTDLASQTEVKLAGKSDKNHTHDDIYCSQAETASLISDAKEEVFDDAQALVIALEEQTEEKLANKSNANHKHNDLYYTETETDNLISQSENRSMLLVTDLASQTDVKLSEKSDKNHTHDDIYCSQAETASLISDAKEEVFDDAQELIIALEEQTEEKLANKSNANHKHNDLYYTETETDNLISQSENRSLLLVTDLASQTEVKLSGKSDKTHTHDDIYYSQAETASLISDAKEEVFDDAQELVIALETQTEEKLAGKSDTEHTHWFLKAYGGSNTIMLNSNGNMYPLYDNTQDIGMYFDDGGRKYFKTINCYSVNNVSDMRIKDKIDTNLESYVKMLDLITPTSYMLKPDMEKGVYKRNVGYLAQEVQTALHNVGLKDDDFGALFYNAEIEKKGGESYGLNYSQFIPILHAKIKQLEEKYNAKIDEYDKKIAELDEKLAMYLSSN